MQTTKAASERALVCIDCRYIRERPSGIGALVQAIVRRVPALAPDLRFLLLKHPLAPPRLSTSPNVSEVTVAYEANGPVTLLFLPHVVDLKQVSLFHATFNILPRGLRIPSIVTIHDLMWITRPALSRTAGVWGRVETLFYRVGIERALREASRIIAVSRSTASEIASVDEGAAARTRVIPPAAPLFEDEDDRTSAASDDGENQSIVAKLIGSAVPFVLVVGQFSPYKNHEVALRAFAAAFADRPDVHLVFVHRLGRGESVLGPVVRRLGIGDRVHFLKSVSERELDALYRRALTLCHPSLHEGFGLPVAEAMARGCPVVAGDRGALPEVAGGAALLVDPEDARAVAAALRRVAVDRRLAEALRAAGLRKSAERSWDRYARAHVDLYREVLEVGSSAGRTPARAVRPPRAVSA